LILLLWLVHLSDKGPLGIFESNFAMLLSV